MIVHNNIINTYKEIILNLYNKLQIIIMINFMKIFVMKYCKIKQEIKYILKK